jgi:radical SAM protein with 4Fe4S-binding SPASM domain
MNNLLDAFLDTLLDLALTVTNWAIVRLFPFFRSKTGWENPNVRNITGLTYLLRGAWITSPNLDAWRARRAELFPVVLQVQTINRCNASCQMCPYPYTVHLESRSSMDDALYTRIITECANENDFIELVPMAQNEPLLDVKMEDRIAEFKQMAKPHQVVEIVTNGSALTPTRFQKLVESGVDTITFSLSAFTEATYNKLIQGLSWKQVIRNLEAIALSPLKAKVNIFLRYVRQTGNEEEFPAFQKYWNQKGLNVANYEVNNRSGSLENYNRLQPYKSFFFKKIRKSMGRVLFKGSCPHAFGIMHVLSNGDVPLCANDWHNRHILGNLREQSIREIYNSKVMNEIRDLMDQGRFDQIEACRDCSFMQEWLPQRRVKETV